MSEKIYVKPVKTKKEILQFIKFPWKVYQDDPYWVPPLLTERKSFLDPNKNPFFAHADVNFFMAYKGSEPVGTIAAIINHSHNNIHKDTTGFFGFFETLENPAIASNLLTIAGDWLRKRGITEMRGPMNFSTHDTCGLLIDGFDSSPTIMMPYNPPYYVEFIENYGFSKASDLFAYKVDPANLPEHLLKVSKKAASISNLKVRNLDLSHSDKELKFIKKLYNESMSNNWGYVPINDEEFDYIAKDLKSIVDPDLVFFAEINDEIVGFAISIPDYNILFKKMNGRLFPFGIFKFLWSKKDINIMRIWAIGVRQEFRNKPIAPLLYLKTWLTCMKKGYKFAEASWIHENNKSMNRALRWMGFEIYKIYRIYDYSLMRKDYQ